MYRNGALSERTMSEATANQRHQVPAELLQPVSLKSWTKLLLLIPGGPRSKTELQKLQDRVANRFEGQWEQAVEYINKRHDRFLNKARGLLTFDGLVLAALTAVYRESHRIPAKLVLAGSVCAVIAAGMLLLNQCLVHFGDLGKYEDAKKELPSSVIQIAVHGKSIVVAGVLSFLAMLCLLMALGFVELIQ
jgi:uncharacterized membrane protein YidH (DUF202 family)